MAAGAGDLGHGARDLSLVFSDEDLAPKVFRCLPPCDGGECVLSCRSYGGLLPDLVVTGMDLHWATALGPTLTACVYNQGEGEAPAGTPVTFRWDVDPEAIATILLAAPLPPGQGVEVVYLWANPPRSEGGCTAWAVAGDDGSGPRQIPRDSECNVDNNESKHVLAGLCGPG